MPEAGVNGTRLFYADRGEGAPFIVLHGGLGLDHVYMRDALRPLEEVARLIYVDQRGNGRSARPPLDTITMPQLAEDVDALREHIGLDRVGLIGHSYGGFVALEYATRYPNRTSHLIAVSTSPGRFEPTPDELTERPDPSWITPEIEAATATWTATTPSTDNELRDMLAQTAPVYLKSVDPSKLLARLDGTIFDAAAGAQGAVALADWSVVAALGRVTARTLVVCGRYDLLTTPECSKRLSTAIQGAELVWFEDSGHFPWIEEPEAFFDAVRSFVARTT